MNINRYATSSIITIKEYGLKSLMVTISIFLDNKQIFFLFYTKIIHINLIHILLKFKYY
jgi:hypothetical protein